MYRCSSDCGYVSKSYFGLCPRCKDGVGEEYEESSTSKAGKPYQVKEQYEITAVDKNAVKDEVVMNTKYKSFDMVLSEAGGFVKQQVVLLAASPGVGKSTLCVSVSNDRTIYIGTEESKNQINGRFLRVNPESKAKIAAVTSFDSVMEVIDKTEEDFVVIDSLNNINNGMDSYVKAAKNLIEITQLLKQKDKFGIVVSQVTKSGEVTGMNTLLHTVDTVLYLERAADSDNVILSSGKNRFGEVGSIAIFRHAKDEFVEVGSDVDRDPEAVGVTYAKVKFGYRNVTVGVEALVAPTSLTVGLRRVNGTSASRVQQIIGVLAYNAEDVNLTNKDVYVYVSNGLTVNDTKIDLAVANSILSSYFKTPSVFGVEEVQGEISLNGYVKDGPVSHVKELIQMYRIKSRTVK